MVQGGDSPPMPAEGGRRPTEDSLGLPAEKAPELFSPTQGRDRLASIAR
jgi:hypothetical protein